MNRSWHFIIEDTIEFSSTSPFEWAFIFQNRSSQSKVRILRHLFWNSKHLKMFKMSEISNFWTAGPILENKSSFERARWAEFNGFFHYKMPSAVQKLFQKYWTKKSTFRMFFKMSEFFQLSELNLVSTNIFPESWCNFGLNSASISRLVFSWNLTRPGYCFQP